jgi:hypothetical protein
MAHLKSFENGPAPAYSNNLVDDIRKQCPNIFMVCMRNKNRNVVVYEARISENKTLLDPPITAYWLILEPSYQEPRRKSGITHDREELAYIDHMFAWGFHAKRLSDTEAHFSFKAYEKDLTLRLVDGVPYLFSLKGPKKYLLQQMYVKASENMHLMRLSDNVASIMIKGLCIDTKPYEPVSVYLKGGPK